MFTVQLSDTSNVSAHSHLLAVLWKPRVHLRQFTIWRNKIHHSQLQHSKCAMPHCLLSALRQVLTSIRKFFFFFAAGDVSGGTRPLAMAATSSWRLRWTRCAVCTILVRGVRRYGLATISDNVSVHSSSSVWQYSLQCYNTWLYTRIITNNSN